VAPTTDAPAGLAFELGIDAGVRIGDGRTGFGLAALSFLDISGWLLGFEGRADSYQPIEDGEPVGALGLALLAGRRLRFGTLALDLVAGPAIAVDGFSSSSTMVVDRPAVVRPIEMPAERENSPRLRLGARLNFRARSVFRTFVGVDGDFGLRRPAPDLAVAAGQLPFWTVGLVLGASVGTL
jgi:hypothetical protein